MEENNYDNYFHTLVPSHVSYSLKIGKDKDFFSRMKRTAPLKYSTISFLSPSGDLSMGYYKYLFIVERFVSKAQSMTLWLDDNNQQSNFGSFLYSFNIYKRPSQWMRNRHVILDGDTLLNTSIHRRWRSIYFAFLVFKGLYMGKKDILLGSGQVFASHPLSSFFTLKYIRSFEKQHSIDSAYGYALAMSNLDLSNRKKWLRYVSLLRSVKSVFQLEDSHDSVFYTLYSIYPEMYSQ